MAVKVVKTDDIITRAKERFKIAYESFEDTYNEMRDDLRFKNGEQWPQAIRLERENDDRPCLRINKMPQFTDKVMGELRQSRPAVKIRPVDDDADPETADVMGGLWRNIEVQSDAEIIYDSGADAMVSCGYGAWRVDKKYVSNESFDQEIVILPIKNQFAVLLDPASVKWDRSDGRYGFIYEDMPRSVFKSKYPDKTPMDFSGGGDDLNNWCTEDTVRVAEYFEKEEKTHTLLLIKWTSGANAGTLQPIREDMIDAEQEEDTFEIIKKRTVKSSDIYWYRIDGTQILEGPIKLDGKYIPIVPCYGKQTNIDSKIYYHGVVRHAKDSQRLYNYFRSMDAETIALAPKAPWIMTKAMLGPYKNRWQQSNKKNFPYLLFVPDPDSPTAKPERNIPQMANQAILQNVMIADQELHDTTGLQLASLGKKSNEQSGAAIQARAQEGTTGQFTYLDNWRRSIMLTTKIGVDLMPHVYDTKRVARILNEDDTAKNVPINQPFKENKDDEKEKIFDLTVGKYDVAVTVGPSYKTQREESLAALIDFMNILDPQQRSAISDKVAATSDWHGAKDIAKRLKRMVPEQVLGPEDETDEAEEKPKQPSEQELKAQAMAEAMAEAEVETKEAEALIAKHKARKEEALAAKAEAEAAIAEAEAVQAANG